MAPDNEIRPVGTFPGPDSFDKESVALRKLKLGGAKQLAELSNDYAFYTPALVYLNTSITDVMPPFIAEYGQEVVPFSVMFDEPVFEGLEAGSDPSWNYVLFAMELEHWPRFKAWMGSVALQDTPNKTLYRVRTQSVAIADPLAGGFDDMEVTAFVLDTNKGCHYFSPIISAMPKAIYDTSLVYDDTKTMANAIFSGKSDPYGEIDKTLENDNATKDSNT